jgi:N-formylglutamate amidohydrolase
MLPFRFIEPTAPAVPVLVSVPHCGVLFPDEIKDQYQPHLTDKPDDTDWFVDRLYDFAPSFGMTMISAVYSRWVIDLNRDPQSKPLYADGRIITGLCPTTTFLREPLYKDKRTTVGEQEVDRRLKEYYWPYHQQIESTLRELKSKFGKVLLWDCHSIRQVVPTIQKEKFPDLILGDADETSAASSLIHQALGTLKSKSYSVQHNHPFKGGSITRSFGKPAENQHALQLEMSKVNYMNDAEFAYDAVRAEKMRELLKKTLHGLAEVLVKN